MTPIEAVAELERISVDIARADPDRAEVHHGPEIAAAVSALGISPWYADQTRKQQARDEELLGELHVIEDALQWAAKWEEAPADVEAAAEAAYTRLYEVHPGFGWTRSLLVEVMTQVRADLLDPRWATNRAVIGDTDTYLEVVAKRVDPWAAIQLAQIRAQRGDVDALTFALDLLAQPSAGGAS